MLKYIEYMITLAEIPDEISMCINITGCPCNCEGCHSPYLAKDIGTELTTDELKSLIKENQGITCVSFMGGDSDPKSVNQLAKFIKVNYPELKVGWYSGRELLSNDINPRWFNYIKLGPYIKEKGSLRDETTNQRMYEITGEPPVFKFINITNKFWR